MVLVSQLAKIKLFNYNYLGFRV